MAGLDMGKLVTGESSVDPNAGKEIGQNLISGMKSAVDLAQAKQNMEQKAIQTQTMQDELEQKRFSSAVGLMQTAARSNPKFAKSLIPKLQEKFNSLGVAVDPAILDAVASDQEYKNRFMQVAQLLSNPDLPADARAEAMAALSDIGAFDEGLKILGQNALTISRERMQLQGDLAKQRSMQGFQATENAKDRALKAQLAAEEAASKGDTPTAFEETTDKEFAKDLVLWESGGRKAAEKDIKRLETSLDFLEKELAKGNAYSGNVQGRLPDIARSAKARKVQQDVQSAAAGALRATLGAQFTKEEGDRIKNYAYDPTLPPEANIEKVKLALEELRGNFEAVDSKTRYVRKNKTLRGYQGPGFATESRSLMPERAPAPSAQASKAVQDLMNKGLTQEQAEAAVQEFTRKRGK